MNEKMIQDLIDERATQEEEIKKLKKQVHQLGETIVSLVDAGNNLTFEMGYMNWDIISHKAQELLKKLVP